VFAFESSPSIVRLSYIYEYIRQRTRWSDHGAFHRLNLLTFRLHYHWCVKISLSGFINVL
jgi:hypothetical protein